MHAHRPIETLRFLHRSEVRFIVVGGIAAVLNGAPLGTFDIDLVYDRRHDNVDRLQTVLGELNAFGPTDLLATIGDDLGYEELLPRSVEMDIGGGMRIHVLNLETLISLKEQSGSDKDKAMLPILRQTLREKARDRH